ncbi:hypothetical protein B0J13DRAFT_609787 [Dactylonectria estremocensis]|uniref:Uncharacterized protein n=1 Tax=Dactylonectria estremocensis TaxID=1079267 RepID=A0A9P9EES2_9HYPO|nr:hypothetical protein B0J13DRAFT_609787 [Dactylonectria estremocensis]
MSRGWFPFYTSLSDGSLPRNRGWNGADSLPPPLQGRRLDGGIPPGQSSSPFLLALSADRRSPIPLHQSCNTGTNVPILSSKSSSSRHCKTRLERYGTQARRLLSQPTLPPLPPLWLVLDRQSSILDPRLASPLRRFRRFRRLSSIPYRSIVRSSNEATLPCRPTLPQSLLSKLPTMRMAIREQLAAVVPLAILAALAVVSIPTWVFVNRFVISVEREGLTLTASLKASRISAELDLVQTSCYTITSRIFLQDALTNFYTTGKGDWADASQDIESTLAVSADTGLMQARLYSRNKTGASDGGLLNVTAVGIPDITLPYTDSSGDDVKLGDDGMGYPPSLYPNITYINLGYPNPIRSDTPAYAAEAFPGVRIYRDGGLLLGPLVLNKSTSLLSITVPVRDNLDRFILGYITVVALASSLTQVRESREGLGKSGSVLVIGPNEGSNRFNSTNPTSNITYTPDRDTFGNVLVKFILPPETPSGYDDRHKQYQFSNQLDNNPFSVSLYPAAVDSFTGHYDSVNNASSLLSTHHEEGIDVAVGFARTQTPLVNWTVLVEKARWEANEPIDTLRNILLATVFSTVGFIMLLIIPCAHRIANSQTQDRHQADR